MKPLFSSLWVLLCSLAMAQDLATTKSAIGKLNAAPDAVPTATTIAAASKPIAIQLTTDKKTYVTNETVLLTLNTPQAGHVRIYYADAEGSVTLLFPSEAITAEAAQKKVKISDSVAAGQSLISGDGSVTGIGVVIGPPKFGAEQIAAVVTDVPVREDAQIIAAIKNAKTASDAAHLVAGLAIRQDAATKSAIGRVNAEGVPTVLANVGIATVAITTKAK
jgi:hypothetical protein